MGLQSAWTTSLTGLAAAETIIDVVGNNVSNANTVGFKASEALFATQFVQTQSLGSSPTEFNGGTNPRQIGLGVKTAEIRPDFTQGTVEISSSPSDLAIQGDGFFIVQGEQGEKLYTRNGLFKTNAENQLVTINGERLLGYGVDENYQIQPTGLVPLEIPLGAAAVAQATQNVYFEGTLRPNGDVADRASIIQTDILGDASYPYPNEDYGAPLAVGPPSSPPSGTVNAGAGALEGGDYEYVVVFFDDQGNESPPSDSVVITAAAGDEIQLTIPTAPSGPPGDWVGRRVYRRLLGFDNDTYRLIATINDLDVTNTINDGTPQSAVTGNAELFAPQQPPGTRVHNYRIVFANSLGTLEPSRPSPILGGGPISLTGQARAKLVNLPGAADMPPEYDRILVYRSLTADDTDYRLVAELVPNPTGKTVFIDPMTDDLLATQPQLDFDGVRIRATSTKLVDVIRRDGQDTYERVFPETGVLRFTGKKGGRTLATKEFRITADTTVQELLDFFEDALGIQENTDPINPIPPSYFELTGGTIDPGATVTTGTDAGRIRIVGNNGVDNAIDIGLSGLELVGDSGTVYNVNMPFGKIQDAKGESAVADFVVYDSLGIPVNIRVTVVQETRDSTTTTYRWFADSPDNQPLNGVDIAVGTGLIIFDGEGNVVTVTEATVSVERRDVSSASPLEFELHFDDLSGLATEQSSLAANRQDGSPPGTLTSFIIGEDGLIRGIFSNGVTRTLGQIRLARFANNAGLVQRGENLFAAGVNSGLPIEGNPGEQGIGRIISGALELSNTDIGANLVKLILASTQYRGNARVIDAAQRLLDELLNLRR